MTITSLELGDEPPPDVSIVIVSCNTKHLLTRMLTAIADGKDKLRIELIVVDNASRDGSVELLEQQFPDVQLIANSVNVGFGRANNQALSMIRGRYVLLLNTDAFVSPDTLPKTIWFMDEHTSCGVLGVKLVGGDGELKPSCCNFPTPQNIAIKLLHLEKFFPKTPVAEDLSSDHSSLRSCDWVPGCFYLVRREVIEAIGLFDPRYFLYCEEVDHCRRVHEAGWDVTYYPYTQVVHIGFQSGASTFSDKRQIPGFYIESLFLYLRKHHGLAAMLAIAFLMVFIDLSSAVKRSLKRDATVTQMRLQNAWLILRLLGKTRLASRPTR